MKKLKIFVLNPYVQALAAWVFTFGFLGRLIKLVFGTISEMPAFNFLSATNFVIGGVLTGLIFSIHAYVLAIRLNKRQKFPLANWVTGEDLMKIYDISPHQLLQHVEKGLPVYDVSLTDICFHSDEVTPMTEHDLFFATSDNENILMYKIEGWAFKKKDVETYIKQNRS